MSMCAPESITVPNNLAELHSADETASFANRERGRENPSRENGGNDGIVMKDIYASDMDRRTGPLNTRTLSPKLLRAH
jgi:hypothetical protein